MKKLVRFFLILSFLLITSCHKTNKVSPAADRIDKATLMIDRGEYDSAIEILEGAINNHEATPKMRLVLASAYAGRAGVKVENYWDYLVGYDVFVKEPSEDPFPDLIPSERIPENLKDDDKKQITLLNGYYKDFQRLENKTSKIPSIDRKYRNDIYHARKVIKNIDAPSVRLYRSMLTAVVVKSEIVEGNQVVKMWADSQFRLCQNTMPNYSDWLIQVLDLVSDGLNDLGHAYPDENESYQSVRNEIKNGIQLTETLQNQTKNLEDVCQLKK